MSEIRRLFRRSRNRHYPPVAVRQVPHHRGWHEGSADEHHREARIGTARLTGLRAFVESSPAVLLGVG